MSISIERFAAEGTFATYNQFRNETPLVGVFTLQCRACGFEPDDAVVAPRACPKCHSKSWERFARPGSILSNADRT